MRQETKKQFGITAVFAAIAIAFMILLNVIDVQPIGVDGSTVGFAALNKVFADIFQYNGFFHKLTDFLGIFSIGTGLIFAFMGLMQWIKRKNILKVDSEILALGVILIMSGALYFLFTKVTINYRPVAVPGEVELENSFPSSHTMLVFTIFGAYPFFIKKYVKSAKLVMAIDIACLALVVFAPIGRLLSGVHWFTDIIGGALFSLALISFMVSLRLWLNDLKVKYKIITRK